MMVALVGCGGKAAKPKPAEKTPIKQIHLNLSKGSAPHFGPPPKSELEWKLYWQEGKVAADKSKDMDGDFKQVRAEIFNHGVIQTTVNGDQARGSRAPNRLVLSGNIVISAVDQATTLTCSGATYDAGSKTYRATGKVIVKSNSGTLGPLDELWATEDLRRFSSTAGGLN